MKRVLILVLALFMAFSLIACDSGKPTETQKPTETTKAPEETKAGEEATEPTEEVSEEFSWEGSGSVTVYSANASDISEDYFAAFTALTGISVDVVYGGGGELLSRVEAESANPLADVLIGATSDLLAGYTDYFQKFKLESVEPEMIGRDSLEEGYWTEGAGGNIMIFIVNTDLLDEADIPTKFSDLTDEKYFGKIAMADPTAASSAYIHMNIMQQLYGWDFIEDFYRNLDGKLINSSATVPKATVDGEYAIALTIENYGADYSAVAPNAKVIYPEDGTMRTAGGSVMIKDCKNPENAKLFIEFMYSKAIAEITVSYNRRPTRTDVELPVGLGPFEDINFMNYDYDIAGDSETMLDKWTEIVINN